jgi:hypothetical protein
MVINSVSLKSRRWQRVIETVAQTCSDLYCDGQTSWLNKRAVSEKGPHALRGKRGHSCSDETLESYQKCQKNVVDRVGNDLLFHLSCH